MQKFYCYVDESGQDTRGALFIVAVVIAAESRDELERFCLDIERETGKGAVKWIKAEHQRRIAYLERLLAESFPSAYLGFAVYEGTRDYTAMTAQTVALALSAMDVSDYKATVLIDGLPAAHEHAIGKQLRRQGLRIKKVRGIKKDENDALIRLADALCGLVRGALEGQPLLEAIYERMRREGRLQNLREK